MNVHELVKLPHGEANKKIKSAGKWDETKSESYGEEKEWTVIVDVEYKESESRNIKVRASSYDEACEKAEEKALNEFDAIEAVATKAYTL